MPEFKEFQIKLKSEKIYMFIYIRALIDLAK